MARGGLSEYKGSAIAVLSDALRTGTLKRHDVQGAMEVVRRSVTGTDRLKQVALRVLADQSLRVARRHVPDERNEELTPHQNTPPSVPVPSEPPIPMANLNDLLPSVRPRTPNSQHNTARKKRRVSRPNFDQLPPSQSFLQPRPRERLSSIGGISSVIESIRELVEWPLQHRNLYQHLGVQPPRGILLHGPPGCGKTLLAHAIAGELGVSFLRVSGPEIVSGMSGESERNLRHLFDEAKKCQPSIIFLDEIDAIAAKREGATKEMERRIVSQLLSCIDNLSSPDRNQLADKNDATLEGGTISGDEGDSRKTGKSDENTEGSAPCVVILAATNRAESLEPALRRAGRFDREIEIGAPDEEARKAILEKLCENLQLEDNIRYDSLAKRTAGYVGADIELLIKEAGLACVRRFCLGREQRKESCKFDTDMIDEADLVNGGNDETSDLIEDASMQLEELRTPSRAVKPSNGEHNPRGSFFTTEELHGCSIQMPDFEVALDTVQPSALREGFATRPNVSWDNIGSLEGVREEMMMAIVEPIRHPEMFSALGLHAPAGVLLYGPPGCGKTLLARAVASESGANFISVKGPELLSKYVGDSELAVRKVFARAQSSAPCVIFFDELDALAPRRGSGNSSGASERVVNMLLTEMDGFSERKQVFLIAATNRPDIIDPAMLRPGRLDKLIHVPLPDRPGRASILAKLLKGVSLAKEVNLNEISKSEKCEGYSGADLQALIRVAGENALREKMREQQANPSELGSLSTVEIKQRHFDDALDSVKPSVSSQDAKAYRNMVGKLRRTRAVLKTGDD